MRELLSETLRRDGYRVFEYADGLSLLDRVRMIVQGAMGAPIDLIISDVWLPGLTALEVLEGVPRRETFPPVILITAFSDESVNTRMKQVGAAETFDKPFDIDRLRATVRNLISPRRDDDG
jgi:two-component system response regulator (stage 0 sporulation protein F)